MLDNPWFVGIVGGILSGIAATWLSRFIFSKRDSREYAQKVSAVNREVIYSIRPGISEGNIPEFNVLVALISATSRKYGVAEKDVFNIPQVSEELIKEVMDSSFISSATKQEYCKKLLLIREPPPVQLDIFGPEPKFDSKIEYEEKIRSQMLKSMSVLTGATVAILTFILAFSKDKFTFTISSLLVKLPIPLIVLIGLMAVLIAVYLIEDLMKMFLRNEIDRKNERQDQ